MKAFILFLYITLFSVQAAFLRKNVADNELFPFWPSKKTATSSTETGDLDETDSEEGKSLNGTKSITENGLIDLGIHIKDKLNPFLHSIMKDIQNITISGIDRTVPQTSEVTGIVVKRIIEIAMNNTIDLVGLCMQEGVKAASNLTISGFNYTNNIINATANYFANLSSYYVNATFKNRRIAGRINRYLNRIITNILNNTIQISNNTFNSSSVLVSQIKESINTVISNATQQVRDQVFIQSQPAINEAIKQAVAYGGPLSNGVIDMIVRQVFFHVDIAGEQAINSTADIMSENLVNTPFVPELIDTMAAWIRVNWTTTRGMAKAIRTTAKNYERFSEDYHNFTNKIYGAQTTSKVVSKSVSLLPPVILAKKLLRVWVKYPEDFAQTYLLVNNIISSTYNVAPIAASSATFKLFKLLASDVMKSTS